MAFKFNKGSQVIGDLVSADDPQRNTKIDFGDDQIDTKHLKVPHPLAFQRDFVLKPWLEIDPDGEIPGKGAIKLLI